MKLLKFKILQVPDLTIISEVAKEENIDAKDIIQISNAGNGQIHIWYRETEPIGATSDITTDELNTTEAQYNYMRITDLIQQKIDTLDRYCKKTLSGSFFDTDWLKDLIIKDITDANFFNLTNEEVDKKSMELDLLTTKLATVAKMINIGLFEEEWIKKNIFEYKSSK